MECISVARRTAVRRVQPGLSYGSRSGAALMTGAVLNASTYATSKVTAPRLASSLGFPRVLRKWAMSMLMNGLSG
eukprot:9489594-Pyramimonas_sp.AAC.1